MKKEELKMHSNHEANKNQKGVVIGTDAFTGKSVVYNKDEPQKHLVLGHPQ